jgi:hypothetical protein
MKDMGKEGFVGARKRYLSTKNTVPPEKLHRKADVRLAWGQFLVGRDRWARRKP